MRDATTGIAQDKAADVDDSTGGLGRRDELHGRYQTSFGVTPPDECLSAHDPPTPAEDVEDRLVMHLELTPCERAAQLPIDACDSKCAEAVRPRLVDEQGHDLPDADEERGAHAPVAERLVGAGTHVQRKQRPGHQP